MEIIGIAGQLANGKDELGAFLKKELERRFGYEWHHHAWAEVLKQVYYDAFGVTKEFSEEWKRKPDVPPGFDMPVRQALQWIGDGFRQIKSDVWIEATLRKCPDKTFITDCRYINELKRIKEEGGMNVLIIRPDKINDDDHPSEAHLRPLVDFFKNTHGNPIISVSCDRIPPGAEYIDYVVINDGTIQDLEKKVCGPLASFVADHFSLEASEWLEPEDIRRTFVPKGWGYEDWIVNKPQYCGKLLFFKKDRGCSWHYHVKKDETFYVQSGKLLVIYSNNDCVVDGKLEVAGEELGLMFPTIHWRWVNPKVTSHDEIASFNILEPGDDFHVHPGLRHAMYALEDTEMFEFSTEHFEEDSYRLIKGD